MEFVYPFQLSIISNNTENSGKVCKSLILGGAYSHKSLILLYAKKFSGVFRIIPFLGIGNWENTLLNNK
jgi:hypothetical protein